MLRPSLAPFPDQPITNAGIHGPNHHDDHPSHDGFHKDVHHPGRRRRRHGNSRDIHNRDPQPIHTLTTSDPPEAESQRKPVFYSYAHPFSFVFIYLDGRRAALFRFAERPQSRHGEVFFPLSPPAPPSVGTACLPVGRGEGWDGELRNTACFISKYRLDLIYSEAFPGETTKVIQTQLICCHSQFEVPKQVRNDIPFLVMLNSLQHLLYCVCISFATGFCDWQVSIGSHRSPMVERRWTGKEKRGAGASNATQVECPK